MKAAQVAVELLLPCSSRVWKIIGRRGQTDVGIKHLYHGNYKNISTSLLKQGNQRWAGLAAGCTLGTCGPLQSPRVVSGDLSGQSMWIRLLGESCAAKLRVGMKLLGVQVSSILSPGERGRGEQCLRGARSRSSFKQNLLSVSAENLRCTSARCDLSSHKRACFPTWRLVSPSHTHQETIRQLSDTSLSCSRQWLCAAAR